MNQITNTRSTPTNAETRPPLGQHKVWDVAVIGAGPAGAQFIKKYQALNPDHSILWFNAEPYQPYNRIKLSELLAGNINSGHFLDEQASQLQPSDTLHFQFGCSVDFLIPAKNQIIDHHHRSYHYRHLVLATGSRPHIPNVVGHDASGVYTFRDYRDAEQLKARLCHSRKTVVIGGGLLGIEAACAMQQDTTKVSIVQQSHLMNRQLDETAAELLETHIQEKGIQVFRGSGLESIVEKHGRVVAVRLRNGIDIPCDTVVMATGIRPNKEIALNAGINVGLGIRTNAYMQTSVENIYAIGECAEFNGEVHGLVAPGLEQAGVAACHISGVDGQYLGSINSAQLKVANQPVLSTGVLSKQGHPLREEAVFLDTDANTNHTRYIKIILHAGHIIGAICYGNEQQFNRLQQAVQQKERIWPWQSWRFRQTGYLWPQEDSNDIHCWPDQTRVCQCTGVTKGQLTKAITQGAQTVGELSQCTGAGSVCGSCQPLLHELVSPQDDSQPSAIESNGQSMFITTALLALGLFSCWLWVNPLAIKDSWQGFHLSDLWTDGLYKQITGFTMLFLVVVSLLLSLRKRTNLIEKLSFTSLRSMHLILGCTILGILVLHTGLNAGSNMNLALLISFLSASVLGAFTALTLSANSQSRKQTARRVMTHLHIWLTWPLPVLLGFHILSVYWF